MMMDVIGWKIVSHDFSRRSSDGMQVTAPPEFRLDVVTGKGTWFGLV